MRRALSVACAAAIFLLPLIFFWFFGDVWLFIVMAIPDAILLSFWFVVDIFYQGGGIFPFLWKKLIALPFLLWVFIQKNLLKTIGKRAFILLIWIFVPPRYRQYYKRWQRFIRGHIDRLKARLRSKEKTWWVRALEFILWTGILTVAATFVVGTVTICFDISRQAWRFIVWFAELFGDYNFKWLATRGWWLTFGRMLQGLPGRFRGALRKGSSRIFRFAIARRRRTGSRVKKILKEQAHARKARIAQRLLARRPFYY